METIYINDVSLAIDIDDLGVRPLNKIFPDPIEEFFNNEKSMDFTVYSAEIQWNYGEKSEQDTSRLDDDDDDDDDDGNNEYDIDPETGRCTLFFFLSLIITNIVIYVNIDEIIFFSLNLGEKIFREGNFISTIPLSSSSPSDVSLRKKCSMNDEFDHCRNGLRNIC